MSSIGRSSGLSQSTPCFEMDSFSGAPTERVRLSKKFMAQNHMAGAAECRILPTICAKCTEFIRKVLSEQNLLQTPSRFWDWNPESYETLGNSSEYSMKTQCVLCVLVFDPDKAHRVLRMERRFFSASYVELKDTYRKTVYESTVARDEVECMETPFKDDLAEGFDEVPEVQGRYPAEHPQSTRVATQIKEWYQDCKSKHLNCNRGQEIVPKRLLQLAAEAKSGRVSLVNMDCFEVPPRSIEYLALSYCWGGSTNSRSLRANIHDREQCGLDLLDLPPAIQDALSVTRQLGFSYLWVDALCICQDDEAEWDLEAAKMANIYGGSAFAISALASPDADVPFLSPRSFEGAKIGSIERLDVEEGAAGEDPLRLFIREHPRTISQELELARLNSRAWAFQERILAPGVLHYGCDQVFWECNEYRGGGISETGFGQEIEAERLYDYKNLRLGGENSGKLWHNLVRDLTRRNLTVFSDRLHAISGLAARLRKMNIFSGPYAAGLWETDLVFHLIWTAEEDRRMSGSVDDAGHTKQNSRVATWSWAHVEKPVWYHGELFSPYKGFQSNLLAPAKFLFDDPGQHLQSTHVGAIVPSYQVLLHGFVQEMTQGAAKHTGADWFRNEVARIFFDTLDLETDDPITCYSIRMVSQSNDRYIEALRVPYEIEYLLLAKVDAEVRKYSKARSVYRRIGKMRLEFGCDDEPLVLNNYRGLISDYGEPILVNGRWQEILLI